MPPAGFKRSRALWDEARRTQENKTKQAQSWLRVILYEIQPIRFSQIDTHGIIDMVRSIASTLLSCLKQTPEWCRQLYVFLRGRTTKQWAIVGGVIIYYYIVRWVHELLDAGPMLVILTSLVAIFTFGLGDNENPDGLSAYSVFNRGFERILGSVDAEALLAQHVGGGFVGALGGGMPEQEDHRPPAAAVARPRRPQAVEDEGDWDSDDDDDNQDDDNNGQGNNRGGARKSGKKARRRNLEQRQELRRQRDAARALGLHGDGDPDDQVAMQRLIEQQIAEEEVQGR